MSLDDDYKKKIIVENQKETEDESGESGESGQGGKSGQIEFRDFLAGEALRDDLLSPEEQRRLLSTHKDTHEGRVKKQQQVRKERELAKNGKAPLQAHRQGGMGASMSSQYKMNPLLANAAQFSGIDRQVTALPTDNLAETNEADRNEIDNEYQLRYAPKNAPRFNPKPQMF